MKKAQAMVILLVFMAMAIVVTTVAAMLLVSSQKATSGFEASADAYFVAEGGIENALMRLLRDPFYNGETLTVGDGVATITVTGQGATVTSAGRVGSFTRTIRVTTSNADNKLKVDTWQEIYP